MSKQLTPADVADLVTKLLTNPSSLGALDTSDQFRDFMTDITKVVCDHCGGEVRYQADFFEHTWYIGVHGNDSLPSLDKNVFSAYDPEGSLAE